MSKNQRNRFIQAIKLCALTALLMAHAHAFGQLKIYPLQKRTAVPVKPNTKNSGARIESSAPLTLPFWDDFSTNTTGVPDTLLWQNSNSVWINSGMGINEPSINVATFDGLDSTNLPYNPNQILVNGFTDKLISQPIDLSISALPVARRDSVFFSFFYQWQGNGEAPDKNDYMVVEFKDRDSVWQNILTIQTKENPDPTIFYDTLLKVGSSTDSTYFHNAFQFRFRRFGRESGPFDTWNIDYVYMNNNRSIKDASYPDQTIASQISHLFGDYNAVPLKHFFARKQLDSVGFDIQNLYSGPSSISYSSTLKSSKYYGASTIPVVDTIALVVKKGVGAPNGFARVRRKLDVLPNPNDSSLFDSLASRIDIKLKMLIISNAVNDTSKNNTSKIDELKFYPVNLHVNDSVSAFYTLRNYYAYDDGVAEYSAGLTNSGNALAYQFDMATPAVDTLLGFNAYFPAFALAPDQTVNFYIYGDTGGLPGKILSVLSGRSLSAPTGLNTFSTILVSPALLVQDKFYIGWKEPQTGHIQVGLDLSNDTGDKIFVNSTNTWQQNDIVHGSLMIRPIFGKGSDISGLPTEEQNAITIYPNPNDGTFFIHGIYDQLQIINTTGQRIAYSSEILLETDTKIILQSPPGLYLVQLQKGKTSQTKRLLIK